MMKLVVVLLIMIYYRKVCILQIVCLQEAEIFQQLMNCSQSIMSFLLTEIMQAKYGFLMF